MKYLDWTTNSLHLRSNSGDYELLHWYINTEDVEGSLITDSDDIDNLDSNSSWATFDCPVTFNTIGIWPKSADGTDINAIAVSGDVLAAGTDFGTVKVYKYPCNQANAGDVELYGHSAHVTGLAMVDQGSSKTLISAGGREGSMIQRSLKF